MHAFPPGCIGSPGTRGTSRLQDKRGHPPKQRPRDNWPRPEQQLRDYYNLLLGVRGAAGRPSSAMDFHPPDDLIS